MRYGETTQWRGAGVAALAHHGLAPKGLQHSRAVAWATWGNVAASKDERWPDLTRGLLSTMWPFHSKSYTAGLPPATRSNGHSNSANEVAEGTLAGEHEITRPWPLDDYPSEEEDPFGHMRQGFDDAPEAVTEIGEP